MAIGGLPVTIVSSNGLPVTIVGGLSDVFGVTFIGASSSLAELQAAIDAAAGAGGGVVMIGPGTMAITGNPALKSNVHITGCGAATVLEIDAGVSTDVFVAGAGQTHCEISNLVIDYQSNANGRHIINFGTNAKFATVRNVVFRGIKNRAAITASYQTGGVADADNGNILIEGCRVENGDGAGLCVIYGKTAVPAYKIRIKDNYVYGGGSMALLVSDSPEFDAFIDGEFTGNTIIGNGTGTFGAIPCELWGITNWVISGNNVKDATRGIGVTRGKNYVVAKNVIEDQDTYAFEIGSPDGAIYAGNVARRCKTLAVINPSSLGAYYCSIVDNHMVGTGLAVESAEEAVKMGSGVHVGHVISRNRFVDIEYLNGAIRIDGSSVANVTDITVEDNHIYASTEFCPIVAIQVRRGTNTKVRRNHIYQLANYTTNNPNYNDSPAFIYAVMGGDVVTVEINDNDITFLGTAAGNVSGIGTNNSGAAALAGMTVRGNRLQGAFSAPLRVASTSGDTIVQDNDTSKATGTNSFNAAVVLRRTNNTYTATSIPTTGSFVIGDWVWNTAGTISGGKVLVGWYRLTTGSAHVSGTDWTPMYATTT